jgi:hypothetical protein
MHKFSADESDFNPYLLLEVRSKQMRAVCPEGIARCHCLNSNGTYTDGPFYYDEDPIGTVVTYVACNPGARFTNFQELFLTRILNAFLNRLRIDS